MNFDDYQKQAHKLAEYKKINEAKIPIWLFTALGLAGETGEILEKFKKYLRTYGTAPIPETLRDDIQAELGDVLWYLSELAKSLGINLSDIASYNIKKLKDRKKRGVLIGEGDNR